MTMTRKPQTLRFWRGRLPHWEVKNGRYFITLHLAGAIPIAGRQRLRQLSRQLRNVVGRESPQWLRLQRAIFGEMERWLDHAPQVDWLRRPPVAELVMEAIERRQKSSRWEMLAYVVMPTHLHLFCEIGEGGLEATLKDFKRWTGHAAIAALGMESPPRFWQREWFDHWSRSDAEDERIVEYIRQNPVKARLVADWRKWPYGSWVR